MRNIVILISGSGSNMVAIAHAAQREAWHQKFQSRVCTVISSRSDAKGLQMATELGLPTQVVDHRAFADQGDPRAAFDQALMQAIDVHQPALVVLAGFMRILTPAFVAHYAGRLINVHPSLLPAFPGLNTHQRAIDAGCRFAGATVPILAQAVVPVLPGDTADTLAARVLSQEHLMYPRAVTELLTSLTT
jgi:phosphoribosylglycinamide formyltransferase-1